MKLEIELGAHTHMIDIPRIDRNLQCTIDGNAVEADAVEIAPGIYSILIAGQSFEVRVEKFGSGLRIAAGSAEYSAQVRDPRKWQKIRSAAASSEGRQNVIASMPGRVVRVLVKAGDTVSAGQGIVVVEAMKMQNEVRSPKAGSIERLLVCEGQAINAGDIIAVIV